MKIVSLNNAVAEEVSGNLLFSGNVQTQFLLNEEFGSGNIHIVNVKFATGAKNKFHTHSTAQVLFVIEGKGIVATRDQEQIVTQGTAIYIPAGEDHWHGATQDSSFAHLSILPQPSEMKITGE